MRIAVTRNEDGRESQWDGGAVGSSRGGGGPETVIQCGREEQAAAGEGARSGSAARVPGGSFQARRARRRRDWFAGSRVRAARARAEESREQRERAEDEPCAGEERLLSPGLPALPVRSPRLLRWLGQLLVLEEAAAGGGRGPGWAAAAGSARGGETAAAEPPPQRWFAVSCTDQTQLFSFPFSSLPPPQLDGAASKEPKPTPVGSLKFLDRGWGWRRSRPAVQVWKDFGEGELGEGVFAGFAAGRAGQGRGSLGPSPRSQMEEQTQ
uniref:Uncharacterized protein LOC110221571 n=1 Tax=Phascolarctos cinereus TaxID=38626 RepID=A0A6P5LTT5_PHACI|nr:uncharacterized protein LOC110221571 [Phascolarctos cinereus]